MDKPGHHIERVFFPCILNELNVIISKVSKREITRVYLSILVNEWITHLRYLSISKRFTDKQNNNHTKSSRGEWVPQLPFTPRCASNWQEFCTDYVTFSVRISSYIANKITQREIKQVFSGKVRKVVQYYKGESGLQFIKLDLVTAVNKSNCYPGKILNLSAIVGFLIRKRYKEMSNWFWTLRLKWSKKYDMKMHFLTKTEKGEAVRAEHFQREYPRGKTKRGVEPSERCTAPTAMDAQN